MKTPNCEEQKENGRLEAAPLTIDDEIQARHLLETLVGDGELVLVNKRAMLSLVAETARIIAGPEPPLQKATKLAEWLIEQVEVSDLMASDQELEQRIIAASQIS